MFVIVFALALAGQAAPPPAPSEQWTEYKDDAEGFSVCYPAGRLSSVPSKQKPDGLQFASNDGAKLKFWSREDNRDKLLSYANKDLTNEVENADGRFVFNSKGGSIFAPWDYAEIVFGGRTHYNLLQRSRTRVFYMRLSVPDRLTEEYRPIVDRLVKCFRPILPKG